MDLCFEKCLPCATVLPNNAEGRRIFDNWRVANTPVCRAFFTKAWGFKEGMMNAVVAEIRAGRTGTRHKHTTGHKRLRKVTEDVEQWWMSWVADHGCRMPDEPVVVIPRQDWNMIWKTYYQAITSHYMILADHISWLYHLTVPFGRTI